MTTVHYRKCQALQCSQQTAAQMHTACEQAYSKPHPPLPPISPVVDQKDIKYRATIAVIMVYHATYHQSANLEISTVLANGDLKDCVYTACMHIFLIKNLTVGRKVEICISGMYFPFSAKGSILVCYRRSRALLESRISFEDGTLYWVRALIGVLSPQTGRVSLLPFYATTPCSRAKWWLFVIQVLTIGNV